MAWLWPVVDHARYSPHLRSLINPAIEGTFNGRHTEIANSARIQGSRTGTNSQQEHGTYARAKHASAEAVDAAPLALLAGGIAIGAIAGALIPRTEREKHALAPLGRELNRRASAAIAEARETGRDEFSELGLTKRAAKSQAKSLFDGVSQALSNVGAAAAKGAAARS